MINKKIAYSSLHSKTKIDPITNCWLWTGSLYIDRYGRIGLNYKRYRVHRLSAYIYYDLDLDNKKATVNHKCKHRNCWNPDHLYVGDYCDNNNDTLKAGNQANNAKTHCPYGHELSGTNIKIYHGSRHCMICKRKRSLDKYYSDKNE